MRRLQILDLSENVLFRIHIDIEKLSSLRQLNIDNNAINDFSGFEKLEKLTSLENIVFSNPFKLPSSVRKYMSESLKFNFPFKIRLVQISKIFKASVNKTTPQVAQQSIKKTSIYDYAKNPTFIYDNIIEFEDEIKGKDAEGIDMDLWLKTGERISTATIKLKQMKIIKLLYEKGTRLDIPNLNGDIPFQIVKKTGIINSMYLFLENPELYLPILNKKIKYQDSLILKCMENFDRQSPVIKYNKYKTILYRLGISNRGQDFYLFAEDEAILRNGQPIEIQYEPLKIRYSYLKEDTNLSNTQLNYIYRLILEQYANENLLKLDEDWLNAGKNTQANTPTTKTFSLGQLSSQNYHALIIGVQDYEYWGKLKKPFADADSLIKTLTTFYLFDKQQITLLRNPRRADLIDALDSLTEVLTENDNLLIFYAGHGKEDKTLDEGYWIPIDGKTDKRTNWFSNDELKKYLKAMKCKHILLVADACFAGKLFRGAQSDEPKKMNLDKSMAILSDYKKKSRVGITSTKLTVVPGLYLFALLAACLTGQ